MEARCRPLPPRTHPHSGDVTPVSMPSSLPLDDLIGQTFYINGSLWRYLYDRGRRRFALRRTEVAFPLERAVELIASGDVLWTPPERLERKEEMTMESVQQRIALLEAFRRSPACLESTDWSLRRRIDEQLAESRGWLTRRALMSGEGKDDGN
jgi:hypothetical protein